MDSKGGGGPREELAVFGGGCFWCLQPVFEALAGVRRVVVGYAGGAVERPTYEDVCTGRTGHAEVVEIAFDPAVVGYRDLLAVFFTVHDPTTLNRQGVDVGSQYRSVVFYRDEGQRRAAEEVIRELEASGAWPAPVVTRLEPLRAFWPAEPEHQDYYLRHPRAPYCLVTITPKLARLRRAHAEKLRRP